MPTLVDVDKTPDSRAEASTILLTELYPPSVGGSAVLFYETYKRLRGSPVLVITEDAASRTTTGSQDGRDPQILPHRVGTSDWGIVRPRAMRHHLSTARVIARASKRHGGVVHCGRALPEGVAAWLARMMGGPRYVCWAHGEDLVTARSSRELSFLTTQVYRHASCAIANSQNTARMLEGFGVEPSRTAVVYPGVDAERFRPDVPGSTTIRRRYTGHDDVFLLSVGRLQKRKGHDLVIRTLAEHASVLGGVQYVIVGDGEERSTLEALAGQSGVGDRVHFAGEVSAESLPMYYAACDLFILPNRVEGGDIEGFGIVFLEAASAAKAIIAGNSGGVPEAVADGVTGILVSGTDHNELSAAIHRLVADVPARTAMGLAGRERVLSAFTWERAAQKLLAAHQRASRAT